MKRFPSKEQKVPFSVGWSLGGMIAQELTSILLEKGSPPASLTLVCTHSGGDRLLPPISSLPRVIEVQS